MKINELYAYLHVGGAAKAIGVYAAVFGATEKFRLTEPGGRIVHAELDFGGTTLMLADEFPEMGIRGPLALGGASATNSPAGRRCRRGGSPRSRGGRRGR